jgi:hypothetical protein
LYVYPNVYICSTFTDRAVFWINAVDRPNRFAIFDSSGQVTSSGWVGTANYPGPWGPSLNIVTPLAIPFTWNSSTNRYVTVEAGPGSISDAYEWILSCDNSVGLFKFGATCAEACSGVPDIPLYSSCSAAIFGPGCDVRTITGQEPTHGYYASGGYCYYISESAYEPISTDAALPGSPVVIPPSDYTIVISKTVCSTVTPTPTITPTPTRTSTPSITPTPTRTPAVQSVIRLNECAAYGSRVLSVTFTLLPSDGDVIQVTSGPFTGCFTVSYSKPGAGGDGVLGGWFSIGDCGSCTF